MDVEADEGVDVEVVVGGVDGVVVEVVVDVVVDAVVVVVDVVVCIASRYFNIKPRLLTEPSDRNRMVSVFPVDT